MKKLLIGSIVVASLFLGWQTYGRFFAPTGGIGAPSAGTFITKQGGTGTSSPSGILYGDGSAELKTVTIGNNITFSGGVISSSAGSGAGSGTISTSSTPTIGQLPFWTGVSTVGSVATGTVSASTGLTVTANRYVIGGNLGIGAALGYSIPTTAEQTIWNTRDWSFGTNYNALALTPSTTIPVWVQGTLYASSTAVFAGNVSAHNFTATSTTATSTFGHVNVTGSTFGFNSEYFRDFTGTGLQNVGNALTLNATGDWTGTLDGIDGASLVQTSRTITIAGTSNQIASSAGAQDLSANRTWTLSLPSHVIFPGSYVATTGSTTNATSTSLAVLNLSAASCDVKSTTGGSLYCGTDATGGGTPGGSDTEIQFNNAGAFGGITGSVYDGTDLTINIGAGTFAAIGATSVLSDGASASFGITSSLPYLTSNGSNALFSTLNLTTDRNYSFPDWSGTFAIATSTLDAPAFTATSTSVASMFRKVLFTEATTSSLYVGTGQVKGFVTMVAPYSTTTWSGTTTLYMAPAVAPGTFTEVRCETNTGTVAVSLYDGTNRADYIATASTTINTYGYSTNNTFTANESIRVDIGTPASSPRQVACRFKYVYN